MKKFVFGVLFSMAATGVASAANLGPAGDASAGKGKAAACVACHGEGGNSVVPTFPKLAGQGERYLYKQMKDIQCGFLSADDQKARKCTGRSVPTMAGQLDGKSDQDLADIAAYFASQPHSGGQARKDDMLARGESIYRAGIPSVGVAACMGCHSPTGLGNAPAGFPAIGGQHADYIEAQLRAFRAAADGSTENIRNNDGDTQMMRSVVKHMSDNDIKAVANYIAGLYQ